MKFKHITVALVCALGVSFLSGCGGGPEDTAEEGLKALLSGDLASFQKVAYPSEEWAPMAAGTASEGLSADVVKDSKVEDKGEESWVHFPVKWKGEDREIIVVLDKLSGDWKISKIRFE